MKLATIKVISKEHGDTEVIINEADFDSRFHRRPCTSESENGAANAITSTNAPKGAGTPPKGASQGKEKDADKGKKEANPKSKVAAKAKDETAKDESPIDETPQSTTQSGETTDAGATANAGEGLAS